MVCVSILKYSKTPIYRGVWGQGNIRGKSGSAVNRGFVWLPLCMFSPIWGKGNGRGKSGRGKSGFYCIYKLSTNCRKFDFSKILELSVAQKGHCRENARYTIVNTADLLLYLYHIPLSVYPIYRPALTFSIITSISF